MDFKALMNTSEYDFLQSLPEEIKKNIEGKEYMIDHMGKSGSKVLIFEDMVLKITDKPCDDKDAVEMMRWLKGKIPAPQVIVFEEDDSWRCYAIESRETGVVMGVLTFSKQNMLHEYELGWMMTGEYTGKSYASEAAEAFAEYFCRTQEVDYMIVVMDVDNPASRRTAEKSGFRLFEKRTVYDYHYNRYCDDYFYFRRYWSGCTLKDRYYGDSPYYGRSTSDGRDEMC